jgi:hypothetical protein
MTRNNPGFSYTKIPPPERCMNARAGQSYQMKISVYKQVNISHVISLSGARGGSVG